jgi:hypothetical protein
MQITTIGFDLAKNVFQLHGSDVKEKVVARKQLRRGQVMAFFQSSAAVPDRYGGLRTIGMADGPEDGTLTLALSMRSRNSSASLPCPIRASPAAICMAIE